MTGADGLSRDEPLWVWAEGDPDRIVLRDDERALTAAEAVVAAREIAAAFAAAGAVAGEEVLLAALGPATTVVAALAALSTGLDVRAVPSVAFGGSGWTAAAVRATPGCGCTTVVRAADGTAACAHDGDPSRVSFGGDRSGRLRGADPVAPGPPPDALATSSALLADVMGVPAGAVGLLLPHRHRFTLGLALGFVHARREVRFLDGDTGRLQGVIDGGAIDTLVATAGALDTLVSDPGFARLLASLERVVSLGAAPRVRSALASAGRDVLVEHWDDEGVRDIRAPESTAIEGFWSWSARDSERIAVIAPDGTGMTAGDLRDRAERLAARFGELPARAVVVSLLADAVDTLVAYLAACLSGVQLLTASPDASSDELARYCDLVRPALVIADDASAARVPPGWDVGLARDPVTSAYAPSTVSAGGVVPHTSGTTGPPKVVLLPDRMLSPRLVGAAERATANRFGFGEGGRHLVAGRLHEGAPSYFASVALHVGETLVLMERWSPSVAVALLARHDVTSAFLTPSMFESLLALPPAARPSSFPALRSVVHATAACRVETKRAMLDWWGPVLIDCYSPTEALGTYVTPREWLARPGTVGRPLPGAAVRVRRPDGTPCAAGTVGHVFLFESGFSYADDSAPVARSDGFVSVGDLGYLDDDGWLFLQGRDTDYVSVGGTKFHPSVVEECLRRVDGVTDCAVTGAPHPRLGQVVVAVVVSGDPGPALRSALLRRARAELPIVQVPTRVVFADALPRDSTGTLLRRALRDLL